MAQLVKYLPAMWETWIRSLGFEDPLEKGMATHSNILAWRIHMDKGALQAAVHGVTKSWERTKQLSIIKSTQLISIIDMQNWNKYMEYFAHIHRSNAVL